MNQLAVYPLKGDARKTIIGSFVDNLVKAMDEVEKAAQALKAEATRDKYR